MGSVGRGQPPAGALAGLSDRIEALNGELTVTGRPAEGTTLHAEIPLG
jgi:signal transduction histidine kinase